MNYIDFYNYTLLPLIASVFVMVIWWKVFSGLMIGMNKTLSDDVTENRTWREILKDTLLGDGIKLGRAIDSAFILAVQIVLLSIGILMLYDRLGYENGNQAVAIVFGIGILYLILTTVYVLPSALLEATPTTYYEVTATHPTGQVMTFVIPRYALKNIKRRIEKIGANYQLTELGAFKPGWKRYFQTRKLIKQWEALPINV